MYWGENMARGKSNHTMFHKIMGNLEKNAGHRGPNWGKIYDIFSPSVLIFSPLGHAIIFLLSQTVYWGEKCRFPRGGINIHFRPKYRPLLSTPSPPPPCHPLLSPPRHLAKAGHRTTRRRRWRPAGLRWRLLWRAAPIQIRKASF